MIRISLRRDGALQPSQYGRFRTAVATRFRIERELGHGGMATVLLAEDLKNHRQVALKVLRPEIATMIGADRFLREIEIAAQLQHPHILPLFDSDAADGFLYMIMPLIEGGTLRDRLMREPAPTDAECLAVVRQVARGLAYAHDRGLVHRDIKPANILMSGDHVLVGDFGIARLVQAAMPPQDRLTESGLIIGTPTYMAPEQLRDASNLDGRADQYSLACVLYEMLTGAPPSTAARGPDTLQNAIRKSRPELPGRIVQAVIRALSEDPGGRFATVLHFAEALEPEPAFRLDLLLPGFLRRAPNWVRYGTLAGAGVAAVWWLVSTSNGGGCPTVGPADTTLYAILPFAHPGGAEPIGEEQLLADAIERWVGVDAMDQFQLREVLGRSDKRPQVLDEARDIACRAGVRRFVLGDVQRTGAGDSLRVSARLYDLGPGETPLGRATLRIATSLEGSDSLFASLADSLLFRGNPPPEGPALSGTRLLPARQAFDAGQRALAAWALPLADTGFRTAAAFDPEYAAANLWLALVRLWQGREPALWLASAQRAATGSLRPGDSLMAEAALMAGRGDLGLACPAWRSLAHQEPRRFAAWYGLSFCLRTDSVVVRDAKSPSGWRYRASYHEAQQAYLTAIRLLPSILASPGNTVGSLSSSFLYVSATRHRKGHALPPDTGTFAAAPGWVGDSLVFVPWQRAPNVEIWAPAASNPAEAIRRQRLLLDTLALTWVTESPVSVAAHLALIEAMALAVDPAAVDSAHAARRHAREPAAVVEVMDAEVRTLLQFGLPDRPDYLRRARALADSILDTPALTATADPTVIAWLAALTGRAGRAAAAARSSAAQPDWDLPKPLLEAAPGLLMYAAMGGPTDSIFALWRLTRDAIDQGLPEGRRFERAMEDLGRPATMAFPAETLPSLFALRNKGDWLLTLQAAFADSGRRAVTRWRDSVGPGLADKPSTFDTAWPIARLLLAAGDTALATRYLEGLLSGIRFRSYQSFGNPVEIATMMQLMMLRARIAGQAGDVRSARRWAGAAVALWSDADETFLPEIRRLRSLAG